MDEVERNGQKVACAPKKNLIKKSNLMSSKETIFKKIEAALGDSPKVELPEYDDAILHSPPKLVGDDVWQIFSRNFSAVSGIPMENIQQLIDLLRQEKAELGYCDPALMDAVGHHLVSAGFKVETDYDRDRYDDYQFGITRAAGVIAESGTVILNDETTSNRLAALAPWIHIAVLESGTPIQRTIPDAIAHLGASPNVIWATGPSKTADVEGILIEGVHGPGKQILLKI